MTNAIAAVGEIPKATGAGGFNVILDIAALLSAIIWPVVLLVIALTYRKEIPGLVKGIAGRLSKLEFAGVSIELAKAKEFVPDWSAGALDLRQKATAIEVNDSTAKTFLEQLRQKGDGDYAVVNLGDGNEWLTSRLFIMAIVFARMKGIKAFVFLETAGNVRNRFVCWAQPEKIRWALARRFPWLEQAYAEAYSAILQGRAFVVTNEGRLGNQFSKDDPQPSIELLQEYLQRVQMTGPPPPSDAQDWIAISDVPPIGPTQEHAQWINSRNLEEMLGEDAMSSSISSSELRSKTTLGQLKVILSVTARFVPVTGPDQRFEYLVDRTVILEQVARQLAAQTEDRS
jgi:hypothetical protein